MIPQFLIELEIYLHLTVLDFNVSCMWFAVFLDVKLYIMVEVYKRFAGTSCLHFQGERTSRARNISDIAREVKGWVELRTSGRSVPVATLFYPEAGSIAFLRNVRKYLQVLWLLVWLILRPWKWRQYAHTKFRQSSTRLHDITFQKILFIFTAVRTPNLTILILQLGALNSPRDVWSPNDPMTLCREVIPVRPSVIYRQCRPQWTNL
jgi:hypothetical protein